MIQYVIYLRKSRTDIESESRGEPETLARHEKTLLDLAKQMNLHVTQIYREVVSGETIAARPIVQKLLREVEYGTWTGVLVMEIERLARGDTIDQGIVAKTFKEKNTKIITPTKSYDPSNEFDEEYFEFGLFMSRREYKTIHRRMQRGRIASVQEGKYISSTAPFGYTKIKITNDKGYTLQPNSEAPIVKLIYELYANGETMVRIASKLDAMHIKPKHAKSWGKYTIRDILKNPVYIGKIRWAYRKEKKIQSAEKITKCRTISKEYMEVDGLHPPIVDKYLFDQVQAMMQRKRSLPTKTNTTLQNPLSGLVYCKKCGTLMTRLGPNTKTTYATLKCPNRNCNNVSSPIFLIEKNIVIELTEWLSPYKNNSIPIILENELTTHLMTKKNTLSRLESELLRITDQIHNTFDLLEQGIYTPDIFTQRNTFLTKKKEQLLHTIDITNTSIEREQSYKPIQDTNIAYIKNIIADYDIIPTAELKNLALKSILSRIEYQKDNPNTRGNLLNENFSLTLYPLTIN